MPAVGQNLHVAEQANMTGNMGELRQLLWGHVSVRRLYICHVVQTKSTSHWLETRQPTPLL